MSNNKANKDPMVKSYNHNIDKTFIAETIIKLLTEDDGGSKFIHHNFDICEVLICKKPDIHIHFDYSIDDVIFVSYLSIKGIEIKLGDELKIKIEDAVTVWVTNRVKEELCKENKSKIISKICKYLLTLFQL